MPNANQIERAGGSGEAADSDDAVVQGGDLAAGALALDILVAVVITALLRQRLGGRGWRVVHQLSYAAWLASVVHTVGIGTDSTNPWVLLVLGVCVGSVVVALSGRFLVGTIRRAAA